MNQSQRLIAAALIGGFTFAAQATTNALDDARSGNSATAPVQTAANSARPSDMDRRNALPGGELNTVNASASMQRSPDTRAMGAAPATMNTEQRAMTPAERARWGTPD